MTILVDNINFDILGWARERAAMDEDMAAKKAGLSVSRLKAMESGEKPPTQKQLFKLAKVYRRPVATFYLDNPPAKSDYGVDFRRADRDVSKQDEALLEALLRDVHARQNLVKNLVEDEEGGSYRLGFVNSAKGKSAKAVAKSIASVLGIDYKDAQKRSGKASDLFNYYRAKAEAAGVFVLCIGNLGSHHTDLSTDVFRGFAISDKIAPFVVINKNDSKVAWQFTLFHELAHIWLGQTGISGRLHMDENDFRGRAVEKICNEVAGEILLPAEAFPTSPIPKDMEKAKEIVGEIANTWSVSNSMVAYRLFLEGCFVSKDTFEKMLRYYRELAKQAEQAKKIEKQSKKRQGGPDSNVLKRYWLGHSLLKLVHRSLKGGALSHTKASKILGVKLGRVSGFLQDIR